MEIRLSQPQLKLKLSLVEAELGNTGLTSKRFKDRWYEHKQESTNQKRENTGLNHFLKVKII